MSVQKKFMLKLETKEGERLNFFGIIHLTEKQEDLLLSPEDFYKKFGGKIPEGLHHEIEWEAIPKICKDVKKGLVHIHEQDEKNFVCWTTQIHTEEESLEVVKVAAFGMLYGAKTGKDFADVFIECKESVSQTIKKLSELCDMDHEALLFFKEVTIEATKRHNTLAGRIFFL